ncbi:transposase [Desulfofundulus thermosubterraneus]|uniref:Transposase, Mutator family n=1 Tax=Desulfofundulus thermosubterraneus DSM 16057 TaxID=1121432 RepID=A0A1M6KZ33_9FIRM|nr:transposase [Desulfofundulus thermosubterraneus]SHJ64159.1 Transposase, Mutator family [Desulfofundulus thermosubterraneus DSM 16057]
MKFFDWLKGMDLVVSDDHKGLVNAIEAHFQGATWQWYQTHFIRNILDACPKSLQGKAARASAVDFRRAGHKDGQAVVAE